MSVPLIELVRWKWLYYASLGAFVTILWASAVGNPLVASVALFSLFSWWSMLPGMASHYLKETNLGDFFTVLLALNVGPIIAAIVGVINIWAAFVFGRGERVLVLTRVSLSAFIATLAVPWMYMLAGKSVLTTLYYYTAFFYVTLLLITLWFSKRGALHVLKFTVLAVPLAFVTNTLYLRIFGDFSVWFMNPSFSVNPLLLGGLGLFLGFPLFSKATTWYVKRYITKQEVSFKYSPIDT